MPLTDDQIEKLFQELNLVLPALVNNPILTPLDCDQIRDSLEDAGLRLTRKAELEGELLLRLHSAGVVSSDTVIRNLVGATAEKLVEVEGQAAALQSAIGITPDGVMGPITEAKLDEMAIRAITPTAREIANVLQHFPDLQVEVYALLGHQIKFTETAAG
jgi:hypothetical protein